MFNDDIEDKIKEVEEDQTDSIDDGYELENLGSRRRLQTIGRK